jgi:hypothetical protein
LADNSSSGSVSRFALSRGGGTVRPVARGHISKLAVELVARQQPTLIELEPDAE